MAKTYFQPQNKVTSVALHSNLLAGSATPADDQMNLNNLYSDDQW